MKKIINFCGNCPFLNCDFSDSEYYSCNLSKFLGSTDYFIEDKEEETTPIWCPLKNDIFSFEFKYFSTERLDNINSVKNEIEELENFFDHSINYECSEAEEKTLKLRDAYIKLYDLQTNEEPNLEDFQEEIIGEIEDIKQQLNSLDNISSELQKSLKDLGDVNILYR